jgi:hypothetical protein
MIMTTESDNTQVLATQQLRSKVRPYVTFGVVFVYLATIAFAIIWLLLDDQTDNALALLSGLSAVSTGIVGFWFGTRGTGGQELGNGTITKNEPSVMPRNSLLEIHKILDQKKLSFSDMAKDLGLSDANLVELLMTNNAVTEAQKKSISVFIGSEIKDIFPAAPV